MQTSSTDYLWKKIKDKTMTASVARVTSCAPETTIFCYTALSHKNILVVTIKIMTVVMIIIL